MRILTFCLTIALLLSPGRIRAADDAPRAWGDWPRWGDQGDGTYRNPVLPSDFADTDCIRVGSDYYAVSSTFQFSPGFIILQSKDMVNWRIAGHAVPDLGLISPEMTWSRMNRYGAGIWAGAIRYHNNKFWVYFCTPDEGYFMTTAATPAGPWDTLHKMNYPQSGGWDDPCPFWDDDGQGYLAGSNFKDGYKIHLWKMTPDGRDLVPESDQVIHQSRGSEANKLYKINGVYYHFYSENGNGGRMMMMERSSNIFGPYAGNRQLSYAEKEFKEPNQGGLVQTQNGAWYFLTHHGSGSWEGRCVSLLPVTWLDGWPIIGQPDAKGIGHFVWSGVKPVAGGPMATPAASDDFNEKSLPPQWEWNYQPRDAMWSLTERPGWLRLRAFQPLQPGNLMKAGNTLTQRIFRTSSNEVVIKLDLSGMADGQKCGLCHFSRSHSCLGATQQGGKRLLEYESNGKITPGPLLAGNDLWLRSTWGQDGLSHFSYSLDGRTFAAFGDPYQFAWGYYRGDRIGIYSFNDNGTAGYVDVDFFRYIYSAPPFGRDVPE
jgi:beta-xylosidase